MDSATNSERGRPLKRLALILNSLLSPAGSLRQSMALECSLQGLFLYTDVAFNYRCTPRIVLDTD